MNFRTVRVCKWLHIVVSVMLVLVDEMAQKQDHRLGISLGFAVRLRMVCRPSKMVQIKEFANGLQEFGDELRLVVGQEIGEDSVGDYPMIEEDGHDMQCGGWRRPNGSYRF